MNRTHDSIHSCDDLKTIVSVIAIVVAPLLILVVDFPSHNRMLQELQNSGHALIFGIIALGLLNITATWASRLVSRRSRQYLLALLAATGLGLLLEAIQMVGARDASLVDWLLDIVGTLAFLGIVAPFDRRLVAEWNWGASLKTASFVGAFLLLSGAFAPPSAWLLTYYFRDREFPTLASFESAWERRLIETEHSTVEFVAPPDLFVPVAGEKVARLKLFPRKYPGMEIWEPSPDWTGYDYLLVSILSENSIDLRLVIRINDLGHNQLYEDRFNRAFDLHLGMNELKIDLHDVRLAPAGREMDMTRVTSIIFFTERPRDTLTLYLDNVRLE